MTTTDPCFIPPVPSCAQQVHGAWLAAGNDARNGQRGRETTTVRGGVARLRPSAVRHETGARGASGSYRLLCQNALLRLRVPRSYARAYIKIRLRNGQGFGGSPRGGRGARVNVIARVKKKEAERA